ncbi:hypothetical protein [Acetobacter senegalensis]|uniref:hypothetical protein n=1 Tax=Acetobacter senegalensis TaxID=446692 RepID=UPI00128AE977|nr:hypothetical protein [Acetobacter senegalensis]MPQ75099.1 hypothetical protein [Acetobacter senegalensis]
MIGRNKTSHAAGSDIRQVGGDAVQINLKVEPLSQTACLDGHQADIELRKWAIQTILLSPHPLPSSLERLGSSSLRLASFAKHGTLFPELRAVEDTSLFGRRIKAGNKDVRGFQRIKNFALIARKFIYFPFKFFYGWFHKESSFVGFVEDSTMDDGGRCGNVPPNAAASKGTPLNRPRCFQK